MPQRSTSVVGFQSKARGVVALEYAILAAALATAIVFLFMPDVSGAFMSMLTSLFNNVSRIAH